MATSTDPCPQVLLRGQALLLPVLHPSPSSAHPSAHPGSQECQGPLLLAAPSLQGILLTPTSPALSQTSKPSSLRAATSFLLAGFPLTAEHPSGHAACSSTCTTQGAHHFPPLPGGSFSTLQLCRPLVTGCEVLSVPTTLQTVGISHGVNFNSLRFPVFLLKETLLEMGAEGA